MEKLGDGLVITVLGILSWQDFRARRISAFLLLLLAGGLLVTAFQNHSALEIGKFFLLNLAFLIFQFLLLWFWFMLRRKKIAGIINSQIGLGDVLFVICLALAFSPANFLLFYTAGMLLTLFGAILLRIFRSETNKEIPLAGALAIPFIFLCCWRLIDPASNFYSDEWLIRLLDTL